jgi:hypothetical protein
VRPLFALSVDTGKLEHELRAIPSVRRIGFAEPRVGELFVGIIVDTSTTEVFDFVGAVVEEFAREHAGDAVILFDLVDEAHEAELLYAEQVVYA